MCCHLALCLWLILFYYNTIKYNAVEKHHNLKSDCHGASPNFQDLQQPIKKYINNSKM
jgi:hypothetical protein